MKKKIIVGLLVISALSFAAMNTNQINMNYNTQRGIHYTQMMNELSTSQQNELTNMVQDHREASYKKGLDIRSKQLELEKLLSKDKVNWQSVEKVNKQISDMRAKQRLDNIKFRKTVEDKFGITMGYKGMDGHMGGGMMNGNGRHMGNGMMNGNGRHMGGRMMNGTRGY
ncbi:periplasmic heavy metal sensor (plasmid) [Fusobacteria bacterium ZRK30]|nr:periplasmic heavy metal sensor [Fusobacteria bacterium ZRK30]